MLSLQVREHPVYHLIKARICKKQGDHAGAVKTLQMAMQLPGIRGDNSVSACRVSHVKSAHN